MGSATMQGELWSAVAEEWAEVVEPGHTNLFEAMLDAAGVGPGTAVLDAGCGSGGLSVLASERGAQVSGLDAAEEMLRLARARVPDGEFRVGELEALPYEEERFDSTLACQSFFFASDPIDALRELQRVTKEGGTVVVSTWGKAEANDLRHIFGAVAQRMPAPPNGKGPFALAEEGVLEGMLDAAGLRPIGDGWVEAPWSFANSDEAWRAFLASSNVQMLLRHVPATELRGVLEEALTRFQKPDGSGTIARQFRYVAAKA